MSDKYPEWLVHRIAEVLAMAVDDTTLYGPDPRYPELKGDHSVDYIDEWEDGAKAVLKELGFRQTAFNFWRSAPFEEPK